MGTATGRGATLGEALALLVETDGHQLTTLIDAKDHKTVVTRGDLGDLAASFAAGLLDAGVRPGDRVVIAHPTSADFLGAFWGCQAIGAVAVPAAPVPAGQNESAEAHRLRVIIDRADPRAVIGTDDVRQHLQRLATGGRLPWSIVDPVAGVRWDDLDDPPVGPDAPAVIQFTSGSTSDPRGCLLTHASVVANVEAMQERLEIDQPTVGCNWCPLHHDMGLVGAVILPVMSGYVDAMLQPTGEFVVNPSSWLRRLSDHRAEMSTAPNFAFALVNRQLRRGVPDLDLSSVRFILNGAEPISPAVAAEFVAHLAPCGLRPDVLHPSYGLAEHVVFAASSPGGVRTRTFDRGHLQAGGAAVEVGPEPGGLEVVSLGRPLQGVDLRVVDEQGVAVGTGQVGEVELRSAAVMVGYFGDPEATARKIRHGWLRTGDVGLLDEHGELFLVGRVDDLIILNGRNFYAYDIEQAVTTVPGTRIGAAAAFARLGAEGEQLVVVAEARTRDPGPFVTAVRAACHELVGVVPADVVVARPGSLPHTSSGKLRRNEVRQRYEDGAYDGRPAATPASDPPVVEPAAAVPEGAGR
jgi:fatty-acyl-CoA synthase